MLDRLINYVQYIAEGFNYVLDAGLTKLANLKESIQSAFSSVAQYFSSSTSSTPISTTPLTEGALRTADAVDEAATEAFGVSTVRIPRPLALTIHSSSNVLPVWSSFIGPMAPVLPITGSELTASAPLASYALANRATLDLSDITPAQYRKLVRMVLQNLSSITTPTTFRVNLASGRSITVQITPVSERRAATNLEDIFASSQAARNPLTALLDGSVEGASAPRALTRRPFQEPLRIEPLHSASNAAVATETVAPQETVKPPFKFPEGFELLWLDYPPLGFDTEKFANAFIKYHAIKITKGLKPSERYSYIRKDIKSAFLRAGS
jgi:hypothetical protein